MESEEIRERVLYIMMMMTIVPESWAKNNLFEHVFQYLFIYSPFVFFL